MRIKVHALGTDLRDNDQQLVRTRTHARAYTHMNNNTQKNARKHAARTWGAHGSMARRGQRTHETCAVARAQGCDGT